MKTPDGYLKTHLAIPARKTLEGMTKRDRDTKRNRGGFKEYDTSKINGIEDVIGGNFSPECTENHRRAQERFLQIPTQGHEGQTQFSSNKKIGR